MGSYPEEPPKKAVDGYMGLPEDLKIGSNTPGPHPASKTRPVHYDEWSAPSASGYCVSKHLVGEPPPGKPFKVIMMGAGAAGIDFLHHAPSALADLDVEIVCYDKNADVGGTWYENRYPGCACDVPSVSYSFAWRPYPEWTSYYSKSKQIWQYMRTIVDEEGMMKYIKLKTQVIRADWDDEKSRWIIHLGRVGEKEGTFDEEWDEECDIFLNGTGFLKYVTSICGVYRTVVTDKYDCGIVRGDGRRFLALSPSKAGCSIQLGMRRTST